MFLKWNICKFHDPEDESTKSFSISLLEINFLKVKTDQQLDSFKLYPNVGFIKWFEKFYKIDTLSELSNNSI